MAINNKDLDPSFNIPIIPSEYGAVRGGEWYYTHNRPGTKWFDLVSNKKGWTVDFNLKVDDVINSDLVLSDDKVSGVGIYVNDGTKKETISFFNQEIIFKNANKRLVFDTTLETDYRLIGKENNLSLFEKNVDKENYSLINNVDFLSPSTNNANGLKPSVAEDSNGDFHVIWYDDGEIMGQLFYSKSSVIEREYGDSFLEWTDPVLIAENAIGNQFPNIIIDNKEFIYVVYESKVDNYNSIGFVYKNDIGWSSPFNITTSTGGAIYPRLSFDSQYNVCVVWEDHRYIHPEVYFNKFNSYLQAWEGEERITISGYGSYKPSISSYLDNVFISFTKKETNEESLIQLLTYNTLTGAKSSIVTASSSYLNADYSNILANVRGLIFVVWQDNFSGKYEIYSSIFSIDLGVITSQQVVTKSNGGANYPVLSEQQQTGDVYIVWQDYKTNYKEFNILKRDPYWDDPYISAYSPGVKPIETDIYVALYDSSIDEFLSSGNDDPHIGPYYDVKFTFTDNRSSAFPSIPPSFTGELPILYEASIIDVDGFLTNFDLFKQIRCIYYNLDRSSSEFKVDRGISSNDNPSVFQDGMDYLLTSPDYRKEIRFGDFSEVLGCHYVFKNFKYYLNDAVQPFSLMELTAEKFEIEALTAHDVAISNYGDVWIVGTCGMMFYVSNNGSVASVGNTENYDINGPLGNINAITFDNHNYMFINNDNDGVYYSTEHINGFEKIDEITGTVTVLSFDKNNTFFVGTSTGLKIYEIKNENGVVSVIEKNVSNLPTDVYITSIAVDSNNVVWIGSRNGLYRFYKDNFIQFTTENGLPSSWINDIAIRNTAIRYIATSSGIAKMIGSGVDDVINSDDGDIWNNNVKSVMWQDPNILWAGTLSRLNQIVVNDIENSYATFLYEPSFTQSVEKDDLRMYYVVPGEEVISDEDIIEIYINGNRAPHGYTVGYDTTTNQKVILFDCELKNDDIVEVIVRKDLRLMTTFAQTPEEQVSIGSQLIRTRDIDVLAVIKNGVEVNSIYLVTEGGVNSVKVNDFDNALPFDRIHLDTKAPVGTITIPENAQINSSVVKVDITASDVIDGIPGSGVEKMVVSNYPNFTTNGIIPQIEVPFATSVNHDLGLVLGISTLDLDFQSNKGSVISYLSETNEIYAGSSESGALYRYNFLSAEWEKLILYKEENFVDFIVLYNDKLIVSVGHPTQSAKIYEYEYVYDNNGIFDSLTLSKIESFAESRAFSFQELNNKLYIGTGPGNGTPYMQGLGNNGGVLYVYDGITLEEVMRDIDDNIYGLTNVTGESNLLGCTGDSGYVIELDPNNKVSFIIHNDVQPLSTIKYIKYNEEDLIFTGGISDGCIRRSLVGSSSFDSSFNTIPGEVSSLKILNDVLYTSIGKVVYYLSSSGSWVWKYTNNEEIHDITINPTTGDLYIVSNSDITKITPATLSKSVYLKLIDRAGNETVLYDAQGNVKEDFTASILISDLSNFVNENKIFELDERGNNIFTFRSNDRFFSADKIEEEKGTYESEIFDGSNDLVKWESLSWQATELENTRVELYIRVSNSSNDILIEDWIGPFYNDEAGGVDISYLSGQFIQFKSVLTSTVKGISPSFHSATIKAVTTESVHFFTTNFVLPSQIRKGIVTSEKLLPVSADVVFGVNTTNSIDWTDYQEVDENRIFNMNQVGENMKVGIKFISPSRESYDTSDFGEYGPYNEVLYANTIDFGVYNNSSSARKYHFKISLYEDFGLNNLVSDTFSYVNQEGFNVDDSAIPPEGYTIEGGESASALFTVPGSANIKCNTYYFVKIESTYDLDKDEDIDDIDFDLILNDRTFIAGCNTSFVDVIDFDFTNWSSVVEDFHFRIKFYSDPERLNEYLTVFSGNNNTGWFVDDSQIPSAGVTILPKEEKSITYRPLLTDFEANKIYYLSISAHNGNSYTLVSNYYNFKARDVQSLVYCGGYIDVPIVKNFGIMFELEDNQFVTLNI
jgi:hypothetical protein